MVEMRLIRSLHLVLALFFLQLVVGICYSSEPLVVECIYWDPRSYCQFCPLFESIYQDFLAKNRTVNEISKDYQNMVIFRWIDITSQDGIKKKEEYGITVNPLYALGVGGRLVLQGDDFTEANVRMVIEAALNDSTAIVPPTKQLIPVLASAFVFGFLETFSPCLVALLAFVLTYTIGKTNSFQDGFLRVLTFGTGFVSAAVAMSLTVSLVFASLHSVQTALVWTACIFAFLFAFNQFGLLKLPIDTKGVVKKLARRHVLSLGGLILLGFLFYFLDPCLAPIFVAFLPVFSFEVLPLVFLVFCLGAFIPFIFLGSIAGSISKFARTTYKYKATIRMASGFILITYVLYTIIAYFA
jgi:cytochrome c-type biogenesis protein